MTTVATADPTEAELRAALLAVPNDLYVGHAAEPRVQVAKMLSDAITELVALRARAAPPEAGEATPPTEDEITAAILASGSIAASTDFAIKRAIVAFVAGRSRPAGPGARPPKETDR